MPHLAESVPLEAGSMLSGKYRIVSLIGVGGVGRVYLARHVELDTEVAIKMLRPEMAGRPEAVQRFAREARASVRLHSERIARVLDVGSHEGKPYFVMEYLVGSNLMDVRLQGDVDTATFCEFFIQACEGLAAAHAMGVVHRDIKPENLFVVRDSNGWRSLKLLDFGISKFSLTGKYSDIDLASMRTEAMMGTPHYISPEQIRSTKDVDHRADIWSLGAVMFEVLSGGILPFREEREFTSLIAEVLEQPHRSLLDVAPNVPERLCAIIDRCLAKDREQRYQTTAEVALDLLPLAPVRARASAERAVSAMQAAGLMAVNGDFDSLRPRTITRSDWPSAAPSSNAPVTPAPVGSLAAPSVTSASHAPLPSSAPTSAENVRGPAPLPSPRAAAPERILSMPPITLASSAPVSAASTRPAPLNAAPVSAAPVSAAPVSAAPVSAAPVSASVSAATISAAPVSAAHIGAGPASVVQSSSGPQLLSVADVNSAFGRRDPSKQRRRKVALVLCLLTLSLVAGVGLLVRAEHEPTSPLPAAQPSLLEPARVAAPTPPPSSIPPPSAVLSSSAAPPPSNASSVRKPSLKAWVAPRPVAVAPPPVASPPAPSRAPESLSTGKLELKRER